MTFNNDVKKTHSTRFCLKIHRTADSLKFCDMSYLFLPEWLPWKYKQNNEASVNRTTTQTDHVMYQNGCSVWGVSLVFLQIDDPQVMYNV